MTTTEQLAPIVVFEGVGKTFASPSGDIAALQDLHFSVEAGEAVAIMGPSGCGKSTIVNLLAGHDFPSRGSISFRGKKVGGPDRSRSVMFQDDTLLPFRRVIDNVAIGTEIAALQSLTLARRFLAEAAGAISRRGSWIDHHASEQEKARLLSILDAVGMRAFAEKWPRELSGGMRKRVELARTLAQHPDLIALDEPFARLDAFAREELQALVESLWMRTGCTLVTVTHDWVEAVRLADRVIILTDRPARVHSMITVDLPRPRTRTIMASPDFLRLAQSVHDAIASIAANDGTKAS